MAHLSLNIKNMIFGRSLFQLWSPRAFASNDPMDSTLITDGSLVARQSRIAPEAQLEKAADPEETRRVIDCKI